ncbi:peptidase S41 [Clostridia bacterium]|nr:peptidase S41 [Clostridia bacterium]
MEKKITLGTALILAAFAVLLTFMLTYVGVNNRYNKIIDETQLNNKVIAKLTEIDSLISANFMGELDKSKLADSAASGYVYALGDTYAQYYSESDYLELTRYTNGKSVGIGIEITSDKVSGGILIKLVNAGSTAMEAGILAGDIIIGVDGVSTDDLTYAEAVERVRGDVGTTVALTILRGEEERQINVVRAEITRNTVHSRLIGDIGYIKITDFVETTPNDFNSVIDSLTAEGAAKFIFDVRNNPGGLISSVVSVLDRLLPEGPIVHVIVKGEDKIYDSDATELTVPVAVLMNEQTASAAEIFAAAIKDYKKGTLVGTKTFGKGIVQTIYPLSDKSAVKFTTATYNPPFSDNFNGIGVIPDISSAYDEAALAIIAERLLTDDEDTQLQAAIASLQN